ncbi:hypothetical protein EOL71_03305 [Candidatus Saccharibacteria bacterium]|nr:hypothetical protein [Candidatus Saccharibacteria bacterium]
MKTQNPFTGRSSGSLANVTASTYLGQNILKSKPLEVRNPQSPKQLNVREVLSLSAKIARSMYACPSIAKRSARTGRLTSKTARTALIAAILARRGGTPPMMELDNVGITLSGNGIAQTVLTSCTVDDESGAYVASWPTTLPTGAQATDLGKVVIVHMNTGSAFESSSSVARSAGTASGTLPASMQPLIGPFACFVCFDSADGLLYDSIESITQTTV